MKVTDYIINIDKKGIDITVACVSDLHARPCQKVITALKNIHPDAILLAGDIFEIITPYMSDRNQNAYEFVRECIVLAVPLRVVKEGTDDSQFAKKQDQQVDPRLAKLKDFFKD